MSPADETAALVDARDVLKHSELADIVVYEVSGSRIDEATESTYSLQVLTFHEGKELEIRCRVDARGQGGQYIADAGAKFALDVEGEIAEGIQREFAEKVGLMAVYPYVRSAVSQLAASLGLDRPVLPLLRAGHVKLSKDDAAESESE